MALDKAAIGREGTVITYVIDASEVRAFADAIGDPSPVYRDPAAALAAGHPAIPAPPTFATCRRGSDDVRDGLDMDWSRILHGGEELTLHRPLYVGDTIHVGQRVADVFTKEGRSGGVMDFLVLEVVAKDDAGAVVYAVKRTIVVKRAVSSAATDGAGEGSA